MYNMEIKPIYQSIKNTVKTLGVSEYFIRQRLKAGNLPHIKSGIKVLVDVNAFKAELEGKNEGRTL